MVFHPCMTMEPVVDISTKWFRGFLMRSPGINLVDFAGGAAHMTHDTVGGNNTTAVWLSSSKKLDHKIREQEDIEFVLGGAEHMRLTKRYK